MSLSSIQKFKHVVFLLDELLAVHQTECIYMSSGDNIPGFLYTLESPDFFFTSLIDMVWNTTLNNGVQLRQ